MVRRQSIPRENGFALPQEIDFHEVRRRRQILVASKRNQHYPEILPDESVGMHVDRASF
jgi:hypothetical protein